MMKLPQILFWRERIDIVRDRRGRIVGFGHDRVWAGHAIRNWDMPSNGVYALFTSTEMADTKLWHSVLRARLEERERRLFSKHGRLWRAKLTEFDDEADLHLASLDFLLGNGDGEIPQIGLAHRPGPVAGSDH